MSVYIFLVVFIYIYKTLVTQLSFIVNIRMIISCKHADTHTIIRSCAFVYCEK